MKRINILFFRIFKLLLIIAAILISSCDNIEQITTVDSNPEIQNHEITFENGYLNFSNQQTLYAYISSIENELKNASADISSFKSAQNFAVPKGFKSLALKLSQIENKLKNASEDSLNNEIDRFYAELNKALIPENIIHYVVDTARRIKVEGEIYQITEAGTFIYTENLVDEFEDLYSNFLDCYRGFSFQIDSLTYQYGNIKFIDSYHFVNRGNLSLENIIALVSGDNTPKEEFSLKSASDRIISDYTSKYDLTDYRVGGGTAVGIAFSSIGLNNWRSKNFDGDHRVNVNLYDLNYGFFKCAGFTVKFQYKHYVKVNVGIGPWREWVTLASYWLTTNVPEMVIGIDYFKGYTSFNYGLEPTDYTGIAQKFSNDFGSATSNMVFKGFLKEPESLVRNWVSNIHIFGGSIDFMGNSYQDTDAYNALYNSGYEWLTNELKKRTSSFVYNNVKSSDSPVMLVSPGVGKNGSKEYLYLNGVSTYINISEKGTRLGNPSAGIKLIWNSSGYAPSSYGPYLPISFHVEDAYIFGAAKYNGVWKGVRMYIP